MQHANCILKCTACSLLALTEWMVLDNNYSSLFIASPQLNDRSHTRCLDGIVENIERSKVVHGRVGTPSHDRTHVICGASQSMLSARTTAHELHIPTNGNCELTTSAILVV